MKYKFGTLKATLERNINKQGKEKVRGMVVGRVNSAQKKALKAFDNNPYTKEIEAGRFARSRILNTGNLYSFLGFPYNPIPTIRAILEKKTRVSKGRKINSKNRYRFIITGPQIEDVYSATDNQLPWISGRSWVEMLDKGIGNYSNYLFSPGKTFPQSISGTAIQTKTTQRGDSQSVQSSYIKQILENYKQDILKASL